VDAETLAAWVDGGLKGAALEDVRSHVAGCDRCQMLLGAMGRTRPAVPTPGLERTPRRWLAWAVPLTAAATALVIWIAVPKPSSAPVPTPAAVSVAPPPASPSLDTSSLSSALKEEVASPQASREAKQAPPAPVAREAYDAERSLARTDEPLRDAARPEADAREQRALRAPTTAAPAAPPPEAAAGAAAQSANVLAERLQRAPLCGSAWTAALPVAPTELLAGSSPAEGICWVVGRGGAVWRSVDGRTWQRVTFPEMADLSAVTATDARSATVSTADGRTFATSDTGMTWVRQ
jgi:hypothetical protein